MGAPAIGIVPLEHFYSHSDRTMQRQGTLRYSKLQLLELVWKCREVDAVPPGFKRERIRSPEDIFRYYHFLFDDASQEMFYVFLLNAQNRVIAVNLATMGTLNASLVHPREVFRNVLAVPTAAIIVAHNHPSGEAEPSSEDIDITGQLVAAGKVLGIPVHDHIIFAGGRYTSFAERGLL